MARKIPDHADRAVGLLPAAHTRDNWSAFADGIIGRRGQWAEDDDLYVIDALSTKGGNVPDPSIVDYAFLIRDADLALVLAASSIVTLRAEAALLVDEGSPASEGYSLWFYRGPPLSRANNVTAQTVRDLVNAGTILELPSRLSNASVIAIVADELSGADWGIQELEGEFQKLGDLRTLALAFGEQLDRLGELLGLTRDGDDDDTYRIALAWKAAVNVSNGTVEDMLHMASTIESITQVQLLETFPAHMVVYFHGEMISARLRRLLKQMPREGIGVSATSAESLRPFVFGPDGGWFRIQSIYDTVATLYDDPIEAFAVGDRVQLWDVIGDVAGVRRTVVEADQVYDSVYDVRLDSAIGTLPSGWVLLENVTRGVQDPDGFGFEDGYTVYEAVIGTKTLLFLGSALTEFIPGQVVRVLASNEDEFVFTIYDVLPAQAGSPLRASTKLVLIQGFTSVVYDAVVEHVSTEFAELRNINGGLDSPHGELADEWTSPA